MLDAYARYGPALRRKAERILRHEGEAQDIVQGLFVDLWERGETVSELPYLYRAVTNRCLTWLRDTHNRARILAESPHETSLLRSSLDEATMTRDLLYKTLPRLSDEESETLVLHYFDELGQEEIAAVCNISRKTVQRRLLAIRHAVLSLEAETAAPAGAER